ncbi:chitin deacetylase 8-like isoform X2 [Amblyomma americanum]
MIRSACCFLFLIYGHCAFDVARGAECDPAICRLEDNCLCMSNHPPGNLTVAETPQFVMITFDDAVNDQNMGFYRELLAPGRRRNRANGCNMAATFFVSAGYTDYSFVHELHSAGNEIALHSITHLNNMTYWRTLDVAGWEAEFVGVRQLLRDYALIPEKGMVGARAPFLEIGPGHGYAMMQKQGFLYDSSVSMRPGKLPLYPYTLDYGVQEEVCGNVVCPRGVFRGLWMVPLNWFVRNAVGGDGARVESVCPDMPDSCRPQPTTAADMLDFLRSNFDRHYHSNRAPFPVFIHENWLWEPERKRGFLSFVDWLLTKEDVFLVTVEEVVQFMKDPKPLGKYAQKKCSRTTEFQQCSEVHRCHFPESSIPEADCFFGCRPCPERYPWIEAVKIDTPNDRAGPAAAKQLYGAVSVVFFGCVLPFCMCVVAAKCSIRLFSLRCRKRFHIL